MFRGGGFQERVAASTESQEGRSILASPRNSEGSRVTGAERARREVEVDHVEPGAVEGFQLPLFPCLLWLRLCF